MLINKITELDNNYNSMIDLINDIKQKQQVSVSLFASIDDPTELIKELIADQSIEFNKVICCVLDHVVQIQNESKIQYLAEFIGHTCFKKKCLANIDHQVNSLDSGEENSLKRIFIKKILQETGHLITKNKPAAWNPIILDYVRLCATVMLW
ncbi:unnamed protein product [Rotaria sordida]|uniref:Uncharacterized protein n=1 Tax=Rotaria sordida TaxID=392033 RepID=A0A815Z4M8_9BILA|nr:unnamed protein product [Rotaria sordida]CAF1580063.1 unnamed protein product [Rotaria sordida]